MIPWKSKGPNYVVIKKYMIPMLEEGEEEEEMDKKKQLMVFYWIINLKILIFFLADDERLFLQTSLNFILKRKKNAILQLFLNELTPIHNLFKKLELIHSRIIYWL